MTLQEHVQLDQLLLAETNIKTYARRLMQTDQGELCLVFDGIDYAFTLSGNDVTTEKLYAIVPGLLDSVYAMRNTLI